MVVAVREDPNLVRRGTELYAEIPVTFAQAALGAKTSVRTVDGSEEVDIPAGTQSGQEIRLRGRGMPRLRGSGRGDLHILVTVVVPAITKRERELVRQLGEVSGPAVLSKSPSLGDRLRDLFGLTGSTPMRWLALSVEADVEAVEAVSEIFSGGAARSSPWR